MRRSLSEASPVLTVKDVAEFLKIHPSTRSSFGKTGEFPAFRVGGGWRFNLEHIEQWRQERERNANA